MKSKIDLEQVPKIVQAYTADGKTLRQLAREFGVSAPTVAGVLKDAGIPRRKRGRRKRGTESVVAVAVEETIETVTIDNQPRKMGRIVQL